MVAIAFRASSQVINSSASITVAVPVPTVAAGDVLVAFIARIGSGAIGALAGWTLAGTQASGAVTMSCYVRPVTGTEPATYTWTLGSSVVSWGIMCSYSGVDRGAPVRAAGSTVVGAGTAFALNPMISISAGGVGVAAVAATRTASGTATTWTASGTERVDLSTNLGTGTDLSGQVQSSSTIPTADTVYGPSTTASQSQTAGVVLAVTLTQAFPLPAPGVETPVIVEIAPGADLTADPSTWTWVDVSSRARGPVTHTRGRANESSTTQPSTGTIRLANIDSWLTPRHPASPWCGLWGRGTPIRHRVQLPTGTYTRFQGRVASIQPRWPSGNSQYAYVDIEARGALYTLGQGSTPVHSAMYRTILGDGPLAYWPCEDPAGSSQVAQVAAGGEPLQWTGTAPTLGSSGPAGSAGLMSLGADTQFFGPVTSIGNGSGNWSVEFYVKIPSAPSLDTPILEWACGGTFSRWRFTLFVGTSTVGIEAWSTTGATISGYTAAPTPLYGTNWLVTVSAVILGGGTIGYEFGINSLDSGSAGGGHVGGTATGTIGAVTSVYVPGGNSWTRSSWLYGHISVWDRYLDASWGVGAFSHYQSMAGNVGTRAATRIGQMAVVVGVPITYVVPPGSSSAATTTTMPMGAEPIATPLAVMRDAEATDLGILSDGLDAGIRYLCRPDRYNLPVTLALDAARSHVKLPFEPTEDDQRLRDSVVASRSGGGSYRSVDSATQRLQGEYDDQVTVNPVDDSWLPHEAAVRVVQGTVPEMRVPGLALSLRDTPDLLQSWLRMDIGLRYMATGMPSQYPPGGLDLILDQYTETIDSTSWLVQLVGSPYAPWRGWRVEDLVLGRLDTAGSTLQAGAAAGATSLTVATTTGPLWITTVGRPTKFPFDISVGGWQVTVTGITGTSSPQTFTTLPVPAALVAGAAVQLWRPGRLAMGEDDDDRAVHASLR